MERTPHLHPFDRYAPYTDLPALLAASDRPLRKSMRVNTLKSSIPAFLAWAERRKWEVTPVPWCPEAFFIERVDREEALGKDLLHLLGHTYMQEAASMLPVALLDPKPGETVLDMSAAPGSKTTQIAGRMQGKAASAKATVAGGVIVANDVQEKRLWTLKSSLHRLGVTNVVVTKKVGQWFSKNMTERFDRVLCDAPCTAQGTARKDSDALTYCSLENIGKMARLQRELLESAVNAAKVGGTIVYSTCTLTPEENEEVVRSILNKYIDQLEIVDPRSIGADAWGLGKAIEDSMLVQEKALGVDSPIPLLRLWPQTYDTEGFFAAVLRKRAPTRAPIELDWEPYEEKPLPRSRQREIAGVLEERYGVAFVQEGELLLERGDQLLLSTGEVGGFGLPVHDYSLGLPFARRLDSNRVRLSQEVATLRGAGATKNALTLNDADLNTLLHGGDPMCAGELRGDVLLLYRDLCVGSSLAQEGKLRNRLPRWMVAKA
ncbi:MAG: NOL1/NOP2/sun family putative RNA methylase [Candidatus Peregrinibacteria bacterium]|nr:NOL1/NOP2/sun family putative RNA methylase [Candidatus Peregrinibacteria bacterium]